MSRSSHDPRTRKPGPMAQKLGELGLRSTKARVLILSFLAKRRDHPTAEDILQGLRKQGHQVGPATLYQNLGKLADAGLIARLNGPDGLMHFDGNVAPHPHLACLQCGAIIDVEVDICAIQELKPTDPDTGEPISGWSLEEIQLELKGICPNCRDSN